MPVHQNRIQEAAIGRTFLSRTGICLEHDPLLRNTLSGAGSESQQTNFQHASVTLEAGVKIYSVRVDNVHQDAYKALSGLSRAAASAPSSAAEGAAVCLPCKPALLPFAACPSG